MGGVWSRLSVSTHTRNRLAKYGTFIAIAALLTLLLVACSAQAESKEVVEQVSEAIEDESEKPLYDYAAWPEEPTPTPWPEGIVPFTRHGSPPEDVPEIRIETEPNFGNFQFSERDLELKAGDTIIVDFRARKEYHTFTVNGLAIDEIITPGQPNRFSYTFHEAGTFTFFCIPHPYMTGTITVAPAEDSSAE